MDVQRGYGGWMQNELSCRFMNVSLGEKTRETKIHQQFHFCGPFPQSCHWFLTINFTKCPNLSHPLLFSHCCKSQQFPQSPQWHFSQLQWWRPETDFPCKLVVKEASTPLDFVENDGNWKGDVRYNGKIDEHHGNTLLHRGTWCRKSVNSPLQWVSQSSLTNPNETTSNKSTWPNANSFPKGIPTSDPHKPNEMAAAKVMVWLDPCANKRLHELLIGGWLETTTPSTKSWLRLVNLSI